MRHVMPVGPPGDRDRPDDTGGHAVQETFGFDDRVPLRHIEVGEPRAEVKWVVGPGDEGIVFAEDLQEQAHFQCPVGGAGDQECARELERGRQERVGNPPI